MKVLITGAGGQLGRRLRNSAPSEVEVLALGRAEFDVTDPRLVEEVMRRERPDWVINAAAYTQVDDAEAERDAAFAVNGKAPGTLAEAISRHGGRLLHVSTDFVFSGEQSEPYRPADPVGPINVYGESKAAGEKAVCGILPECHLIVRTAWLYDSKGRNFVTTMLNLMRERETLDVVDDQIGTPTRAEGLAIALWSAIDKDLRGIHHWTDAGVASWYDFAVAIYELARQFDLLKTTVEIRPIPSRLFQTRARRPGYSVLDKTETWNALGTIPLHWRDSLARDLRERQIPSA